MSNGTMRVREKNGVIGSREVAIIERIPMLPAKDGKRHFGVIRIPVLADNETCEWIFGDPTPRIVLDPTNTPQER